MFEPYTLNQVLERAAEKRFATASFFCGVGGSALGYALAGGNVLFGVDASRQATIAFQRNFPTARSILADINQIGASDESVRHFLHTHDLADAHLDILDGSPPCTEFSRSGRGQRPFESTAGLIFPFLRIAHCLRPKAILIENVPEFVRSEIFRPAETFLRFGEDDRRHYYSAVRVLDASDFGTPQRRRRALMIALREDIARQAGFAEDARIVRLFPRADAEPSILREALDGLHPNAQAARPYCAALRPSAYRRVAARMRTSPRNPIRIRHLGRDRPFELCRASLDHPSPTLTCLGQAPNGLGGVLHPLANRKFSVPEIKRIMGAPDDIHLEGSVTNAAQQLCNMVPPPLIARVAASVHDLALRGAIETDGD